MAAVDNRMPKTIIEEEDPADVRGIVITDIA